MIDPLVKLSSAGLLALASSLRDGPLSRGISAQGVEHALGRAEPEVERCLAAKLARGLGSDQLAVAIELVLRDRSFRATEVRPAEIVLSGPSVSQIPTRETLAVMMTLLEGSASRLLLVGYAVHQGRKLFERLSDRMKAQPDLDVVMCLDIRRDPNLEVPDREILDSFKSDFFGRQWPWSPRPAIFFDPRSLQTGMERSALHAKCVVADRETAFVSSANFTEAALFRNIEAGVLLHDPEQAAMIDDYFSSLISRGDLSRL